MSGTSGVAEGAAPRPSQDPDPGRLTNGELLDRVRAGDRAAMAEFFRRHGPTIRQRFRRKIGRSLRRLVDSYDVVDSIARRVDRVIARGPRVLESDRALWALVFRVGDRVIADHARALARLRRAENEDRGWAIAMLRKIESAAPGEDPDASEVLDRAFACLESSTDRSILGLWLAGNSHAQTAACLGIAAPAVRKRWERMRQVLVSAFAKDAA